MPPSRSTPQSTTDSTCFCMLPGAPTRNNFGAIDLSPSGLLAFAAGSSVSFVDAYSLQLISGIPLPPPSSLSPSSSSSLSSFITCVRWTPLPLSRDLLSTEPSSNLYLAAADRHGRIALLDFHLSSVVLWLELDQNSKSAVQDLSWVLSQPTSCVLATILGSSSLALYSTTSKVSCCFFKYDVSPEFLSCIRTDPFDAQHFCLLGLKGFLLSVKVLGETEDGVHITKLQIQCDCSELENMMEKDSSFGASTSPASAVFPLYNVKFAFSPHWKHILFVTFPREMVVFDLQYEAILSSAALPRGCGQFLDLLPDPNNEFLYCVHLDGKLSIWRRNEGEQVYVMCVMEELIPSGATTPYSASVLAAAICHSESTLQNVARLYSDAPSSSVDVGFDGHFNFCNNTLHLSKTHLISISDDGKIWNWLLSTEGTDVISMRDSTMISSSHDISFKVDLVRQLQLLSSTVTMLAVPSPSLTATLSCGEIYPSVSVPLVALGTQCGTIDIIDVSTSAVAASFSVHDNAVRGLRWLGNSRVVSFSSNQVQEKPGGYINRLVITCISSGFNQLFRILKKPERTSIRSLRVSSSARYLLLLFHDAPVEVWAVTKNPFMLRSLALPFTVLEWTLPTIPWAVSNGSKQFLHAYKNNVSRTPVGTSTLKDSSFDFNVTSDPYPDDTSETFAFALLNGALGVFEINGRRIRDFRPKWPSSSFVLADGVITSMAYRMPHVVMGDKSGNIRWWDVTSGQSSSFNTHREGIRRIKFSPIVPGDYSCGRIAVLFYDNTFSIFDLDSQDPLANSLLQPQLPGTLVLELDWLPVRTEKQDPLLLCLVGADGSFRVVDVIVNTGDKKTGHQLQSQTFESFLSMPICSHALLPTPHALAFRMILQLGVKSCWFNSCSTVYFNMPRSISGTALLVEDLRTYMIDLPTIGDCAVPEMLLKVLEPYRKKGCILDIERASLYAAIVNKGYAARFSFTAAIFGETAEALFWLRLPGALNHLMNRSVNDTRPQTEVTTISIPVPVCSTMQSRCTSFGNSVTASEKDLLCCNQLRSMAFHQEELWQSAVQRIPWHDNLEGDEAIQRRVHELVLVGNLEAAVTLLLSTSPESSFFYASALRAFALSSAVSRSLFELAVKLTWSRPIDHCQASIFSVRWDSIEKLAPSYKMQASGQMLQL